MCLSLNKYDLNLPLFIARRMRFDPTHKDSISVQIIKIAKLAVALGMSMILIAVATGKGLQKEIQNKAVAFNGHLVVAPFENSESQISVIPIASDPAVLGMLKNEEGVTHVQRVAIKGGLLKAGDQFEGMVMKGVSQDYRWVQLKSFLVAGGFPKLGVNTSNEILLSQVIAQRLSVGVGDEVSAYFQNSRDQLLPNVRRFKVVGLFLSGFPDFDENFVLGDLRHVQRINKWKNDEIGTYEIFTSDLNTAKSAGSSIYHKLPSDLDVIEITHQYATIFQWISLFDFNILIIIFVMIVVGGDQYVHGLVGFDFRALEHGRIVKIFGSW
jgi:lipoprotein-releasing system permease protein